MNEKKSGVTVPFVIFILTTIITILLSMPFLFNIDLEARSSCDSPENARPISGYDLNTHRMLNGLPELTFSSDLYCSASTKAKMIYDDRKNFSHDGYQDHLSNYYKNWRIIGENLAQYFTDDTQEVFEAWRDSETHNKNMLNPKYCEYAIAQYEDVYVTHFGCRNK